ncbi:MAG: zf-HC2 domain-containing protein [Elusimicrobiaceae bacterium]|nr:zf-HC2 domain-containing protein [Elusimicrobiaceae bacterium]
MKPCEDVLLYAQGDLSAAQKKAFEAHLKTCPNCQEELKFLAKLNESLTPPAAPQRVVDKLFSCTTRKKSIWAQCKMMWTATAVAAVCAGVCLMTFLPAAPAFNAHELVAYVNSNVEDEYTAFAQELTDMETYF